MPEPSGTNRVAAPRGVFVAESQRVDRHHEIRVRGEGGHRLVSADDQAGMIRDGLVDFVQRARGIQDQRAFGERAIVGGDLLQLGLAAPTDGGSHIPDDSGNRVVGIELELADILDGHDRLVSPNHTVVHVKSMLLRQVFRHGLIVGRQIFGVYPRAPVAETAREIRRFATQQCADVFPVSDFSRERIAFVDDAVRQQLAFGSACLPGRTRSEQFDFMDFAADGKDSLVRQLDRPAEALETAILSWIAILEGNGGGSSAKFGQLGRGAVAITMVD